MKMFSTTLVLTVLGLGAVSVGLAQKPPDDHVPGRLLVQRVETADLSKVATVLALHGAKVHHDISQIGVSVLEVPEQAADAIAQSLSRTGLFSFVERDHLGSVNATPNDPDFASQWHLFKIQAPNGWDLSEGASSVPIAIIDSGADSTHPDLYPKLLSGWNFLNGTSSTTDTMGHGTAVSGTAGAATDNLTGVAGVGWANPILPLVVVDSTGYASYSNIASAINYAADHGVRIISISIAGSSSSSTLQSAVNYAWNKGAVIFAAAGNNSSSTCMYPACCTNVVAISATEPTDTFASFSNYGNWIALSAPGDGILTTMNGGGYGSWYGTSFATPIAAAVGALALSANPSLTNSALVTLLEKNSDDLGAAGYDPYFGWGRVNAYKAVQAAKNGGSTTDTTPPAVSISSPLTGVTVSGILSVQGTATDNVGVTKVQFFVDGALATSAAASPFSFSWNSGGVANGLHTLTVKAYDAANNVGSASISVNVSNDKTAPTVSISSPLTGASVSGTISVQGAATDNVGVTKVQFFVDGVSAGSGTASAFSFSWNTTTATNASHTLTVKAYDAANNVGSASVTVTANNPVPTTTKDTTPPSVKVTSPTAGAVVSKVVTVGASATDNVGVASVAIYIDNAQVATCSTANCSYNWNTRKAASGTHVIGATAWDTSGNVGYALSVTVTK
jgi:thermitase